MPINPYPFLLAGIDSPAKLAIIGGLGIAGFFGSLLMNLGLRYLGLPRVAANISSVFVFLTIIAGGTLFVAFNYPQLVK